MGTLIFPAERQHQQVHHDTPTIPVHCEICSVVLGVGGCKQGQYGSHLWKLDGIDENGATVFIAAAHYEGANLYSFSVIAALDPTMFRQPTLSARIAIAHLRGEDMAHAKLPF